MNNTKTVSAIVAVLMAAALVVGGTSAAMTTAHSAFAWKQDSYKKRGDDSYKKDTYMKGVENTYKKGRQANGIYGNDNTVTIQASKQNGQVSGHHDTLEQEASNVICTHPSATCSQDGSEAPVASNDNIGSNSDNSDKDPHSGDKISIW
jgi:hypothetical protein